MLQWARAQGCPWDEHTCEQAARCGYLAVLQWARAQGCPWDVWTCALAAIAHRGAGGTLMAAHGTWDVHFAAEAVTSRCCSGRTLMAAHGTSTHCAQAPPAVPQWAHAHGCPWDEHAHRAAEGYLAVLQWAHAHGCPGREHAHRCGLCRPPGGAAGRTLMAAHGREHAHLCGWRPPRGAAVGAPQGCPWDEWTCANAAEGGHRVLQWAHDQAAHGTSTRACMRRVAVISRCAGGGAQGCPWDEHTHAARGGHLEVLQWAHAQGRPW